jgi:outer membrane receptor protein involved in Fe transport
MRSLKYLAAAPLLMPFVAQAQDAPASTVIVVTGRGLEQTPATPAYDVLEIEREDIVSSASGRIEDVLSGVAGFQQFRRSDSRSSNPSAQGVTLRALGGNATSRAQVLLDAVPLADPFFGYIPLSAVAPERLENNSVSRGGGSGRFGGGARGRAIEFEFADARTLGLFSGQASINDREETELSATVAPEIGEGFAVLSGRWDRGEGFFTTPVTQRGPATVPASFDAWSASARLVEPLTDDLELQLRGLTYQDDRVLRFRGADTGSEGTDVSARVVSRGPWQFDALVYSQWRNFTNTVISSTTFNRSLDQKDTPSTGFGGKFEIRPPVGGGHTLRLGTDARVSDGELAEDAYNATTGALTARRFAGGTNSDVGFFIEDDWEIGPLLLTAGLRADRWSIRSGFFRAENLNPAGRITSTVNNLFPERSDWEVSYRAGAVFEVADGLKLRAAAYSGLRLPTLNELYRPFVVFPVTTNANAALTIETLQGYEAGIDWTPLRGVKLALTAFDNKVENAITNVTIGTNVRERRNIDAIKARGLEASAQVEAGAFTLAGTLAYTDAEQRGTGAAAALNGFIPSQTPQWAASASLGWRPAEGMQFSASVRHIGDQYEDDQQIDLLPAATTVDLFGQVPLFDKLSAVARVENLLDEEIVTRNQGGSIDLGTPRTAWIGVRYGF